MKESSRIWLASSLTLAMHAGVAGLLVWHGVQAKPALLPAPSEAIAVTFMAQAAAEPAAPPTPEPPQEVPPPPQPEPVKPAPPEPEKPVTKAEKPMAKPKPAHRHDTQKPVTRKPVPPARQAEPAPAATVVKPAVTAPKPAAAPVLRRAGANEHFPARYRGQPQAPVYPPLAVRRQMEGTTLLEVVIDDSGNVIQLAVKQSAGYDILDRAALEAVRQWKFVPPGGVTGPSRAYVPVKFSLTN